MPNAVCAMLKNAGVRDLGIHTEMFVDGMVDLIEAGVVTGARKQINRHQIVFTFARDRAGTTTSSTATRARRATPSTTRTCPTTSRATTASCPINNTTQIDLQGQAASESDGHRHLTGTGGQLQFVRGAYASRAASRSSAWRPPTSATASDRAASSRRSPRATSSLRRAPT